MQALVLAFAALLAIARAQTCSVAGATIDSVTPIYFASSGSTAYSVCATMIDTPYLPTPAQLTVASQGFPSCSFTFPNALWLGGATQLNLYYGSTCSASLGCSTYCPEVGPNTGLSLTNMWFARNCTVMYATVGVTTNAQFTVTGATVIPPPAPPPPYIPPGPTPDDDSDGDSGLIGSLVGVGCGVIIVIILIVACCRRRSQPQYAVLMSGAPVTGYAAPVVPVVPAQPYYGAAPPPAYAVAPPPPAYGSTPMPAAYAAPPAGYGAPNIYGAPSPYGVPPAGPYGAAPPYGYQQGYAPPPASKV